MINQNNKLCTYLITGLKNSFCLSRINVSNILKHFIQSIRIDNMSHLDKLVPCDEPVVVEVYPPEGQLHPVLVRVDGGLPAAAQQAPATLAVLGKYKTVKISFIFVVIIETHF